MARNIFIELDVIFGLKWFGKGVILGSELVGKGVIFGSKLVGKGDEYVL
jgi:hypothetical protein